VLRFSDQHRAKSSEALYSRDVFEHEALFYSGQESFLKGTVPFITDALALDEPVLVAVGHDKATALKSALGAAAGQVRFIDMQRLGRNPACIIPAWSEFLEVYAVNGRRVRGIGEPIWAGRSEAELAECQRHEALLNLAFADSGAWRLLCPYDTDALPAEVIAEAQRSHPLIEQDGVRRFSHTYLDPRQAPDPFAGSLAQPAASPEQLIFSGEQLSAVRSFVSERAIDAGLSAQRVEDLKLTINELATNSVRYGAGGGVLYMWREKDLLFCELRDSGRIQEPLVGRRNPKADQTTGRGLWLVNHLCDLVQIRSSVAGNVVRVQMSVNS
jgi:anti-sigma regulatory factor (Ser/Thr protein kinase)